MAVSRVSLTSGPISLPVSRLGHTFRPTAEQNVNPPKELHRLGDGGAALAHDLAVAPHPPQPVLPPLPVLPPALALFDQSAELGAAPLVLDLVRRDARDDVVAMREEEADEADVERREGRGYEPGSGRVVGCFGALAYAYTYGMFREGRGYRATDEMGLAGGGWSLRNEGPGTDWPCFDGPDSDVLRSVIVMSESDQYYD